MRTDTSEKGRPMGAEGLCSSSVRPSRLSQRSSRAMAQCSAAASMSLYLCPLRKSAAKWQASP